MARCNCAPHPSCNPKPSGPAPLNYSGNRQAPHPYVYWMSRRTVNVEAGKNVDVELCVDEPTGDKTYTVSAKTDPSVTSHLEQLDTTVAKKADKSYVNTELAKKANTSYVNAELAKKADKSYVNTELAKKANTSYVNTELAKKADKSYVNTELAKKANTSYVNTELAKKADTSYVNTELAKKANTSYVNAELAKKADTSYVNTELAKKADTSYVNLELAKKANQNDMVQALAGKVDKEDGKGLSSNDYTDEDKEKLTSITWLPPEEGGEATSLVKTGEKFRWDEKQDKIEYYLDGARVVDGVLVITGSDGTEVSFAGTGAIDTIAIPEHDLEIIGKKVTIPLATVGAPGVTGESGLVQGICEEFDNNGMVNNGHQP